MGSTTHIVDEAGAVQNRYEYDVWGNITVQEEAVPNRFKFTGQQFDPVAQQYYLRARFYNPVIARFTQEDTYRGDGLNLYAYCRNNSVFFTDPDGNSCGHKDPLSPEQRAIYDAERSKGKTAAQAYVLATNKPANQVVKPALSWNEFQHQNKGYWSKQGLSEAWSRYKSTQVELSPTSATQVQKNYQAGTQFDQHVQQTILSGFSQGTQTSGAHIGDSVLGTQQSYDVSGINGRTKVRPDYSLYNRDGSLAAIGDAKATSYLSNTPQMKGLVQVATTTSSKTLVIYTPQGSGLTLSSPLKENARRSGVKIKIMEVP